MTVFMPLSSIVVNITLPRSIKLSPLVQKRCGKTHRIIKSDGSKVLVENLFILLLKFTFGLFRKPNLRKDVIFT